MGDAERACVELAAVVDAQTRILGAGHTMTLRSKSALGEALAAMGDLDGARAQLEAVLAASSELEPFDIASSHERLAVVLMRLCDFAGSLRQAELAFELRHEISGEDHMNTLTALGNLACMHRNVGNHDEAHRLIMRFVSIALRDPRRFSNVSVRRTLATWLAYSYSDGLGPEFLPLLPALQAGWFQTGAMSDGSDESVIAVFLFHRVAAAIRFEGGLLAEALHSLGFVEQMLERTPGLAEFAKNGLASTCPALVGGLAKIRKVLRVWRQFALDSGK
eukprot:Amastigsp_a177064_33.p3 type:complete len:277 gc:universal Amastigsp_a177064_33:845-15(-)